MRPIINIIQHKSPLVLALIVALTACGGKKDDEADSTALANSPSNAMLIGSENITIVQNGSVTSGPAISGSLRAEREAEIRAQVAGNITSIYVEQGQSVRAGQSLARIDAAGAQDAYYSARAGVNAAQTAASVARRDAERAQKLMAAGAIAERDYQNAQSMASSANAALQDARARLAAAQKQFQNTNVPAPFAGMVGMRSVSVGDVVQPGTQLFVVVDPSSMRLEAAVPAEQLAQVKVGAPVHFTVTGYPGREFMGRVTRVSPMADPTTRQVSIIATIPNTQRTLVSGLFATGRVGSSGKSGPVVPGNAVDTRNPAQATVMRIRGGKVESAKVQIGLKDEGTEQVEILSGVNVGDTLLVGAAQAITPGTVVRVSNPSDK